MIPVIHRQYAVYNMLLYSNRIYRSLHCRIIAEYCNKPFSTIEKQWRIWLAQLENVPLLAGLENVIWQKREIDADS